MIQLTRDRTKVPPDFTGKKRIAKMLLLVEAMRKNELKFNSSIWKNAKDQLKAESHDKCAYCEAPTAVVAHGDVEHFRPKSVYWWLAYCYDNYLFSCQICNQSYKGDEFPIFSTTRFGLDPPFPTSFSANITKAELEALGDRFAPDPVNITVGYTLEKFLKDLAKEKAGLVDPYVVDPEELFKWVADPDLKEVTVQPLNTKVATKRAYESAVKFYGLNRDELKKWRWRVYQEAELFKESLQSPALSAQLKTRIEDQLKAMMAPESEFAGMVRYFVRQVWGLNL